MCRDEQTSLGSMLSKISDGFNNPEKPLRSQSWHPSDDVAEKQNKRKWKTTE